MITLKIDGKIMGGKNHISITRTGQRYPSPSWAAWRDQAVMQIRSQLPRSFMIFTGPCWFQVNYRPPDKRKRDLPALMDAVFHVLERAGVVKDDSQLKWCKEWIEHPAMRESPGITIQVEEYAN